MFWKTEYLGCCNLFPQIKQMQCSLIGIINIKQFLDIHGRTDVYVILRRRQLFELFIYSLIARVSEHVKTSNCLVFIIIVQLHSIFNIRK